MVCLYDVKALNLPGPLVYVVTPSPKPPSANEGRSVPFYYHNWMRRMDSPQNTSTTSTTTTTKTPDLIFAEFESDSGDNMRKSIRKLLEKEKVGPKTSTTSKPIYVPDEEENMKNMHQIVYGSSVEKNEEKEQDPNESSEYFNMYNEDIYQNVPAPVYIPSTTISTTRHTTTTTTAAPTPMNVQNVWHIIDSEKEDHYSDQWNEVPVSPENDKDVTEEMHSKNNDADKDDEIDENFSLPG